jgi:hypothetical protein
LLTASQRSWSNIEHQLLNVVNRFVMANRPSTAQAPLQRSATSAEMPSKPVAKRTLWMGLGLTFLVGALAFFAVSMALFNVFAPPPAPAGQPVAVTIGKARMIVPSTLFRVPEQIKGGELARLDLALDVKSLEPAGNRATESFKAAGLLFISMEEARDGTDPSSRAEELYSRFLEPETSEGPDELVRRRFRTKSPYNDEELYMAPPDGKAFTARCGPIEARSMPPTCLWLVRHKGLDIQIRFAPEHLGDWQKIAAAAFDLLASLGKVDGGATMP